tara:strand:- start:353 stop:619 length:267 start_codon:yes stop_codon:yes gene_type:complete
MAGGGSAEPIGIHNLSILIGSVVTLSVTMLLSINLFRNDGKFSIDGSPVMLFIMFLSGLFLLLWGYWQGNQIKINEDGSDVFEAELID